MIICVIQWQNILKMTWEVEHMLVIYCIDQGILIHICSGNSCLVCKPEMNKMEIKNVAQILKKLVEVEHSPVIIPKEEEM